MVHTNEHSFNDDAGEASEDESETIDDCTNCLYVAYHELDSPRDEEVGGDGATGQTEGDAEPAQPAKARRGRATGV